MGLRRKAKAAKGEGHHWEALEYGDMDSDPPTYSNGGKLSHDRSGATYKKRLEGLLSFCETLPTQTNLHWWGMREDPW